MSTRFETAVKKREKLNQNKTTNREQWAKLGFGSIGGQVHEEDRQLILAELDMRKAERLLAMALHKATPLDTLSLISGRNMNKLPSAADCQAFNDLLKTSKERVRLTSLMQTVDYAIKQYRALEVSYSQLVIYESQVKAAAAMVSYANVAAAFFRYAAELYDWQFAWEEKNFPAEGSKVNAQADFF